MGLTLKQAEALTKGKPRMEAALAEARGLKPDGVDTCPTVQHRTLAVIGDGYWKFAVKVVPMGAPRQSRRDAWAPQECVLRYREFKDALRDGAPVGMTREPVEVRLVAWVGMPASWSKKKRAGMNGHLHRVKPDGDNIFKGVADALWEQDSCIAISRVEKRWCKRGEERVEVEVWE